MNCSLDKEERKPNLLGIPHHDVRFVFLLRKKQLRRNLFLDSTKGRKPIATNITG